MRSHARTPAASRQPTRLNSGQEHCLQSRIVPCRGPRIVWATAYISRPEEPGLVGAWMGSVLHEACRVSMRWLGRAVG